MKKLGFLTAAVAAGILLLGSAPAQAEPVLANDAENTLYFQNAENWIDMDDNNLVSDGDIFYGIMSMQNIMSGGGETWAASNSGSVDSLSGIFMTQVTAVFDGGASHINGPIHIEMGAVDSGLDLGTLTGYGLTNSDFSQADRAAGAVLNLYTDTNTGYQENGAGGGPTDAGKIAADIAAATDGTLWGSLGIEDGYWYSHAPTDDPFALNAATIYSFSGLDFLINNTGYDFMGANDPNEGESDLTVDMYADSKITENLQIVGGPTNYTLHWAYKSDDPATLVVTPEPSTFILLGSGLVGAALIRRKMKKKKS